MAERFMVFPGAVQLLDAFLCTRPKKPWCLVYDFHGTSLKNVLSEGPLAVRVVRALFSDVLKGIQCVHKAGFLHADVNPPNILVLKGGHEPRWSAVVGDLGCAVEVPGASPFTERAFASFHGLGATGQAVSEWCTI